MKMKILHISALPVWPLEGKGGMPSLRETLRGHVRGGHEVFLILPKYNVVGEFAKPVTVDDSEGYEIIQIPCRWAPALSAARRLARRLGGGEEMPYPLRWSLNLALCLLLSVSFIVAVLRFRYDRKRTFDLIYAHNQNSALAGFVLGSLFRIPNVTRLYGTFLADLARKPLVWLRYPVASAGFLIPHSLLICANDGTRGDEVADKLGVDISRFRFWQNGVDLLDRPAQKTRAEVMACFENQPLKATSKWVLSCSRLSYWKRIDRMIHSLQIACANGCDCQLLIAGDGPERARLSKLAADLNVSDRVVWLGAVAHDQIWSLMHVADVFMITNDVTNRCNPLFEAICAGLPVVSVVDPSTSDLLKHGENALLSDKHDFHALGNNLIRVCTDSIVSERLCSAQVDYAQSFWTWGERMKVEVRELERLVAV